ncbi:MAG TPA: MaoC family dehydratase N-terminal domain-containing protein [Acidimicrobiales bacterium]|nr:MaoC family dehydratase N-terminal domain-containing protein [Acidimicrobiales bacterium]
MANTKREKSLTAQPAPRDVPMLVRGQTWEEMTVGSAFRTAARTVTEADLVSFITLFGFNEPLFWDARHASGAGYEGRLVPGALTYCIAEGLTIQSHVLHGTGLAFMHMELDVRGPVVVGDTLEVVVEVTDARPSSKPGRGVVTARNTVFNQRGKDVLVYTPVRLIRGRDYMEP